MINYLSVNETAMNAILQKRSERLRAQLQSIALRNFQGGNWGIVSDCN